MVERCRVSPTDDQRERLEPERYGVCPGRAASPDAAPGRGQADRRGHLEGAPCRGDHGAAG